MPQRSKTVTVNMNAAQITACSTGLKVTFVSVTHLTANFPLLISSSSALTGTGNQLLYSRLQAANAPMAGSFRLSYRGATTADITAVRPMDGVAVAADIASKLNALSTIGAGGVTVTSAKSQLASTNYGRLFRVTFLGPTLGGNVHALQNGHRSVCLHRRCRDPCPTRQRRGSI